MESYVGSRYATLDRGGTLDSGVLKRSYATHVHFVSAVIPLSDFGLFDCETRTFKESVVDFNDLTAEDQCSTDQFSSVFCVGRLVLKLEPCNKFILERRVAIQIFV